MKFETALERLEEIVNSLEDGSLSLDEALKRYEEGVGLARLCTKQLSEAEKKIEILTKTLSGELEAVPFEMSEGDGEKQSAAAGSKSSVRKPEKKSTARGKSSEGNADAEDLF